MASAIADGLADEDSSKQQQEEPQQQRPAAAATLSFRPRVLALSGQPSQSQPLLPLSRKRPQPSPSTAAASAPAPKASALSSSLWRRHENGSYRHYYFRRKPGAAGVVDARLALLKAEWFEGKTHLDIGTNTGKVGWEMYQSFKPSSFLGVDIDPQLIETARTKLKHACRRDGVGHGERVAFECRDFVGGGEEEEGAVAAAAAAAAVRPPQHYDVVTCLSVTKHVHLQGGDAALLRLFRRVYGLLRPGGVFILEPQPWRSYRKRKHASAESARHYSAIRLRPPFTDVLLGEDVGFATMEALGVPPGAAEGYQRPMFCFVKKAAAAEGGEGDVGGCA